VGKSGLVAASSVFRIVCENQNKVGTGFLHKSGIIITAAHVVRDCPAPRIVLLSGQVLLASVTAADDDLDLAILLTLVNLKQIPALPISSGADLTLGTQVVAWGFPAGYTGQVPLLSAGYLAGTDRQGTASGAVFARWVVNAAFNSGNSGGPLVRAGTGDVIGVVSSKLAPLSPSTLIILDALKTQRSGMMYEQVNPDGSKTPISEAQLLASVLDDLRSQVQLVIGYAVFTSDLSQFLRRNGIDP